MVIFYWELIQVGQQIHYIIFNVLILIKELNFILIEEQEFMIIIEYLFIQELQVKEFVSLVMVMLELIKLIQILH
ncbi:MAG: hypothetical protein EBU80_10630 [Chitinophagia bacterium]|nr:hypothetical protein [Chitinophagia bacterium]